MPEVAPQKNNQTSVIGYRGLATSGGRSFTSHGGKTLLLSSWFFLRWCGATGATFARPWTPVFLLSVRPGAVRSQRSRRGDRVVLQPRPAGIGAVIPLDAVERLPVGRGFFDFN